MLLDTVKKKKKEHSKLHLKPYFKLIKPTDKKGENERSLLPAGAPVPELMCLAQTRHLKKMY